MQYTNHFSTQKTPQSEPIPGQAQVKNNAGGFVYSLDSWARMRRFLILGSEGGTYYVKEAPLTQENAKNVIACLENDYKRAVAEIVQVSKDGAAPKNDPAIFALALACAFGPKDSRGIAYAAIPAVCRTGTHLFTFCQAIQDLRGWSRGLRTAVARFYQNEGTPYQLVKYRQRNGWTHRDVLRLCHAKPKTPELAAALAWTTGNKAEALLPQIIQDYEEIQTKKEVDARALELAGKLPWEALPTELLKEKEVWLALLPGMKLTALMRNLNKLSVYAGIDSNLSEHSKFVADQFNLENIVKARLHPLKILEALKTYGAGRGHKGSLTWKPVPRIMDALNEAFYLAFKAVEPTGKATMIGLDVSGSMNSEISGSFLTCAEAAAALAMVLVRTETNYAFIAFADAVRSLEIRPSMTLPDVLKLTNSMAFGPTDCAVPMMAAGKMGWKVDSFQVLTDNETWAGAMHPSQALKHYRQQSGINSTLAVWGMTSTGFTIADPADSRMLDLVGFDSGATAVLRDFVLA